MNDEETKQENDAPQIITVRKKDYQRLKDERDEYLNGWKRAKADYENLLKETKKHRAEFAEWANEQVLMRLLPALDQFEVALHFTPDLDSVPAHERRSFETWITGLEAVRTLWQEAAKDLGLDKISVSGTFNPEIHEAVGHETSDTVPAGDVIRATVNGYRLNGKIVRCAKVIVSKGSERQSSSR
jgi:molecular chaperone GrpE